MKALSVLGGSPRLTRHCCETSFFGPISTDLSFLEEFFFFFHSRCAVPPPDNTLCVTFCCGPGVACRANTVDLHRFPVGQPPANSEWQDNSCHYYYCYY